MEYPGGSGQSTGEDESSPKMLNMYQDTHYRSYNVTGSHASSSTGSTPNLLVQCRGDGALSGKRRQTEGPDPDELPWRWLHDGGRR